jgi:hypothetical protein
MAEAEGKVFVGRGGHRSQSRDPAFILNPRDHFGKLFGSNRHAVIMARALMRNDPDNATRRLPGAHVDSERRPPKSRPSIPSTPSVVRQTIAGFK